MDLFARIFRVVRAHTAASEPSDAYSHLNKEIEQNLSNPRGLETTSTGISDRPHAKKGRAGGLAYGASFKSKAIISLTRWMPGPKHTAQALFS